MVEIRPATLHKHELNSKLRRFLEENPDHLRWARTSPRLDHGSISIRDNDWEYEQRVFLGEPKIGGLSGKPIPNIIGYAHIEWKRTTWTIEEVAEVSTADLAIHPP